MGEEVIRWATKAAAESTAQRRKQLEKNCANITPEIWQVVDEAVLHGHTEARTKIVQATLAERTSAINLLRALGYDVHNTSGIKAGAPFELRITWG